MDKLAALNYLSDYGCYRNEWEEAGMCHLFRNIIKSNLNSFTVQDLKEKIKEAEEN